MLFQDKLDSRNQTSLQRRISQAKFEDVKTFEGFDLKRYSLKIRHAINDLMTAKFIKERNHVIIIGPVGTDSLIASAWNVCLSTKWKSKIDT